MMLEVRTFALGIERTRAKRTGEANPFWAFSAQKDWEWQPDRRERPNKSHFILVLFHYV